MISTQSLTYLINNKLKDAESLFKNGRYASAIYIAGYAIETVLKYKICITLGFNSGFPENKQELTNYLQHINRNNIQPLTISIGQVKNHNLSTLLFYSGIEVRVKNHLLTEWSIINAWNPEDRYKKKRITKNKCQDFLKAAKKLIKEIV